MTDSTVAYTGGPAKLERPSEGWPFKAWHVPKLGSAAVRSRSTLAADLVRHSDGS